MRRLTRDEIDYQASVDTSPALVLELLATILDPPAAVPPSVETFARDRRSLLERLEAER